MRSQKRLAFWFGLAFLSLLLVSCQVAPAPMPTPVPPTPTAVAAPMATATDRVKSPEMRYSGEGQHKVGSQDFALQDGEGTLNVSAIYPGLNATAPDTANGPYPLVVFSPGLGTDPLGLYMNTTLRPIASHGFVILTAAARGEAFRGRGDFWAGAATRPLDMRRLIDYAGKLTAPGGPLAGLIDTERIGVVGHSSGGWTALMEAGAQMDLGWCAAHPDLVAKLPLSNCPQFVPHQGEIATMLGLKSAPAGLWPPMNDTRVDAVIAVSPDGDIWGADYGGVASAKAPTMVMAGSADTDNVPELCAYPIYEHLGSTKKTLAVFEQGDHWLGWSVYGNAITHIMNAFLLAELKGDPEAVKALLPENVTVPGVRFETTVSKERAARGIQPSLSLCRCAAAIRCRGTRLRNGAEVVIPALHSSGFAGFRPSGSRASHEKQSETIGAKPDLTRAAIPSKLVQSNAV
jgi:predicted dienelactone hydrolase